MARASSIEVWNARTSRSLIRTWLTSSSVSLSTERGTAPGAVKSNRSRPGAFSEPACAAASPSAPRRARCTRWVAVCEREMARRRSTSICANAGAPTRDLTAADLAPVHDQAAQRDLDVEHLDLAVRAAAVRRRTRMTPPSGSWPPLSA